MNHLIILLLVVLSAATGYGQKLIKLDSLVQIKANYLDSDNVRTFQIEKVPEVKIIVHDKLSEYFVIEDTLHRDYILVGKKRYIIYSLLGLQQRDYTVNFDLIASYKVDFKNSIYLILEGADIFPLGTNQQVSYIVLKHEKEDWIFVSSYDNAHDMPTDSIHAVKTKKGLVLKGNYLKKIRVEA